MLLQCTVVRFLSRLSPRRFHSHRFLNRVLIYLLSPKILCLLNAGSVSPHNYAINRLYCACEMAQSYAQHSDALQAFHRWRRSPEVQTPGLGGDDLDSTFFIPQSKLEAYLTSNDRVENLLFAVLNPAERPAVAAGYIREHYLRTFATLLCINEGHWIYTFQQYRSLRDDKLPYDTEPADFPYTVNSDLFKKFKAAQWQFCAMALQYDMKDRFRPEVILPITSKTEIGRGGSATIFQIVVDEAYNFLRPHMAGRLSNVILCPSPFPRCNLLTRSRPLNSQVPTRLS